MYEDSLAHLFTFSVALIAGSLASASIVGTAHNPLWFTLANLAGAAALMTPGYRAPICASRHVSFIQTVMAVSGKVRLSEI